MPYSNWVKPVALPPGRPFGLWHCSDRCRTYDAVVARWTELGLSGTPPVISVFEDDGPPPAIS
jgi:hypothetical protein